MNPILSSKYVYENSTDVFIDNKNIESAAKLVLICCVCIEKRVQRVLSEVIVSRGQTLSPRALID